MIHRGLATRSTNGLGVGNGSIPVLYTMKSESRCDIYPKMRLFHGYVVVHHRVVQAVDIESPTTSTCNPQDNFVTVNSTT